MNKINKYIYSFLLIIIILLSILLFISYNNNNNNNNNNNSQLLTKSGTSIISNNSIIDEIDSKTKPYTKFEGKNFLDESFIKELYSLFLSDGLIVDEFISDYKYIKRLDIKYFSHFYYYLLKDLLIFDKKTFNKEDCIKYLGKSFDSIFIEKKSEITIYEEMNNSPIFNNNGMINQFFLSLIFNLYLFYPDNFYETKDISFLDNHNCSDMSFSRDRCEGFKSFIKDSVGINSIIEDDGYYPNIYYINYLNNNITKETFIDQLCSYERN